MKFCNFLQRIPPHSARTLVSLVPRGGVFPGGVLYLWDEEVYLYGVMYGRYKRSGAGFAGLGNDPGVYFQWGVFGGITAA